MELHAQRVCFTLSSSLRAVQSGVNRSPRYVKILRRGVATLGFLVWLLSIRCNPHSWALQATPRSKPFAAALRPGGC